MKVTSIVVLTVLVIVAANDNNKNKPVDEIPGEDPGGVLNEKGFSSPEGKDQHKNDLEVPATVAGEEIGEKKVTVVSECKIKHKNIMYIDASQFKEGPLDELKKSNKPNTIEIDWPPEED